MIILYDKKNNFTRSTTKFTGQKKISLLGRKTNLLRKKIILLGSRRKIILLGKKSIAFICCNILKFVIYFKIFKILQNFANF